MNFSSRNKVVVGISSRSSEGDLRWLMEFIRGTFLELVSDVKYLPITNNNSLEWTDKVGKCSVGILYHTKRHGRINIVDVDGALYDEELQLLYNTLGKSKVLVVLDDVENCSDSERERILDTQSSLRHRSSQLLIFPETGKIEEAKKKKEEFRRFLGNNAGGEDLQVNTKKPEGGYKCRRRIMDMIPGASYFSSDISTIFSHQNSSETSSDSKQNFLSKDVARKHIKSRLKIGIFSRSAQSNYEWLMEWLKAKCMMRPTDVHAVCITNNSTRFYSELPNCSFAILYHTQKQGRLNVTDITDALYNEELQKLSDFLGRENVIVVIDDLQNTDYTKKNRILRNQPSIGRLARDLYLFNEEKSNPENLEDIQRILMEKIEKRRNDEEWALMDNDFPQPDDSGRKPNEPNMSAKDLQSEDFQDSSVDNEPASSGDLKMLSIKEVDLSGARSRKGADDLKGPEAKKIILDPMLTNTAEMSNKLQDLFSSSFLFYDNISATNAIWQDHLNTTQGQFREMKQEIEKLQREKEELQSQNRRLLKKLRENKEVSHKILKEREDTIEMLHKDLRDKERIIERERRRIQNIEQKNEEVLKELREKNMQIDEMYIRKDTTLTIEKLHKDLYDKERIIEREQGIIQNMEHKIEEVLKELREKEVQIEEMQTRKQMLRQDLHEKERTIEVEREAIENMEKVIQQLKSYIHEIETNKTNHEMETRKSNRYEERSPIPGQEDEKTQHEHWRTETMDEGFLWDTTEGNSDARFNHRERSAEIQSLTPANDPIEQLKHLIRQKDEEIKMLKTKAEQQELLIDDILNASEGGEEKAKR